jgi:hypothetical protein
MPYDTSNLPAPPAFPASNASYNSIVGKMHKAALNATTASAAVAAITAIKNHIGGVNTYAKATRRYGDQLIEVLAGPVPDMTPDQVVALIGDEAGPNLKAKSEKPAIPFTVETAAGPIEVDLKKLEVDPSNHPGGIKVTVNTGATFSDKSNARKALKKRGLDHLPVTFEEVGDGRVRPVVGVSDNKGVAYAAERGIKAKVVA